MTLVTIINQFYDYDSKPMWSIIDILHKNFQEDHINSRRFPGFPGVVDNMYLYPSISSQSVTHITLTHM